MLPELPVPGPSAAGPSNAGNNLLYHPTVAEQASHSLSNTNDVITQQIYQALASTPTDYVELNERNITTLSSGAAGSDQPIQFPSCNLSNVLYQRNSTLFAGTNNASGSHGAGQWNQQQQAYTNDSSSYSSNRNAPAYNQQNYPNNRGDSNYVAQNASSYNSSSNQMQANDPASSANNTSSNLSQQNDAKSLRGFRKGSSHQNHSAEGTNGDSNFIEHGNNVANNSSAPTDVKCDIKQELSNSNGQESNKLLHLSVSKLKDEEAQKMENSLKFFAIDNPKQAEELGITNSLPATRRSTRGTNQQSQNNASTNKSHSNLTNNVGGGGADGVSEDEEDSARGARTRNKFFKASEKDREEQRIAELNRKRKAENLEFTENFGKRRRQKSPTPTEEKEEEKPFVPKKVTRKVERKFVPMISKIDAEELMDSNMYQRFNKTVDLIFENMEDVNMQEFEDAERNAKDGDSPELPPEILIPKYQLQDLASETAKLKSLGAMESVPNDRLVKLLNILELNIRDGSKVVPLPSGGDEDEEDDK